MELRDLDHDERLALLGLVRFMGESNRDVTDEESATIAHIAAALGAESYRAIAAEADERFADEDALRAFLRGVGGPEARELIYGAVLEVALGDTIQKSESALLDWLAQEWRVQVSFDPAEGGG
jgi:hypothetical protein